MKVLQEKPPNYAKLAARFDIKDRSIVFPYGDVLYNPNGNPIENHLWVHEMVHIKQQAGKPEEWWDRYIADDTFRLVQELEAYHAQYQFFCKYRKDRNEQAKFLDIIASDLSSPMYGSVIGKADAMREIRL